GSTTSPPPEMGTASRRERDDPLCYCTALGRWHDGAADHGEGPGEETGERPSRVPARRAATVGARDGGAAGQCPGAADGAGEAGGRGATGRRGAAGGVLPPRSAQHVGGSVPGGAGAPRGRVTGGRHRRLVVRGGSDRAALLTGERGALVCSSPLQR